MFKQDIFIVCLRRDVAALIHLQYISSLGVLFYSLNFVLDILLPLKAIISLINIIIEPGVNHIIEVHLTGVYRCSITEGFPRDCIIALVILPGATLTS